MVLLDRRVELYLSTPIIYEYDVSLAIFASDPDLISSWFEHYLNGQGAINADSQSMFYQTTALILSMTLLLIMSDVNF